MDIVNKMAVCLTIGISYTQEGTRILFGIDFRRAADEGFSFTVTSNLNMCASKATGISLELQTGKRVCLMSHLPLLEESDIRATGIEFNLCRHDHSYIIISPVQFIQS